jgi:hypothetical protein
VIQLCIIKWKKQYKQYNTAGTVTKPNRIISEPDMSHLTLILFKHVEIREALSCAHVCFVSPFSHPKIYVCCILSFIHVSITTVPKKIRSHKSTEGQTMQWPNGKWQTIQWRNGKWQTIQWLNGKWQTIQWPNGKWQTIQ